MVAGPSQLYLRALLDSTLKRQKGQDSAILEQILNTKDRKTF